MQDLGAAGLRTLWVVDRQLLVGQAEPLDDGGIHFAFPERARRLVENLQNGKEKRTVGGKRNRRHGHTLLMGRRRLWEWPRTGLSTGSHQNQADGSPQGGPTRPTTLRDSNDAGRYSRWVCCPLLTTQAGLATGPRHGCSTTWHHRAVGPIACHALVAERPQQAEFQISQCELIRLMPSESESLGLGLRPMRN
jgi:hypothetical protein